MATSTYWADKLVIQFLSTCSNRREFLKATTAAGIGLSAFGGIGAIYCSADASKTPVNNPQQKEISDLMWEPTTSERVDRLSAILDQSIKDKDPVIARAAAEGLVPHASQDVAKQLILAYKAFPEEERLQRYLIQLLALNFIVNPKARRNILSFYWIRLTAKASTYNTLVARMVSSAHVRILGVIGYRQLRAFQRLTRQLNLQGYELRYEYFAGFMLWFIIACVNDLFSIPAKEGAYFTFKDRFPGPDTFNAVHMAFMKRLASLQNVLIPKGRPPGKSQEEIKRDEAMYAYSENNKEAWRAVLKDWQKNLENLTSEYNNWDLEKGIDALKSMEEGSLDGRINQTDRELVRDLVIKILNHSYESAKAKREALLIIGSYPELLPGDQDMLMNYLLTSPDDDSVLAAARGLRYREGLPNEKILNFLAQKRQDKEHVKLGRLLEDLLLSSLDSPGAFNALIRSMIMSDNEADKKKRADEMRLWYLGRGNKRDEVLRQATRYLADEIRESVREHLKEWLRDISSINIWIPMPMAEFMLFPATQDGLMTGEQEREATSVADMREFEQIIKELRVYDKNTGMVDKE